MMRIAPTRKQLEYLESIGATVTSKRKAGSVVVRRSQRLGSTQASPAKAKPHHVGFRMFGAAALVVLIAVFTADVNAAAEAASQEPAPAPQVLVDIFKALKSGSDTPIEPELQELVEIPVAGIETAEVAISAPATQLNDSQPAFDHGMPADAEPAWLERMANFESQLDDLRDDVVTKAAVADIVMDYDSRMTVAADALTILESTIQQQGIMVSALVAGVAQVEQRNTGGLAASAGELLQLQGLTDRLYVTTEHQEAALIIQSTWLAVLSVLLMASLLHGYFTAKRVKQNNLGLLSMSLDGQAASVPQTAPPEINGRTSTPTVTAPQPVTDTILPPNEKLSEIISSLDRLQNIKAKPRFSRQPWHIGFATTKGHVRKENQDYCLAFRIAEFEVLIVADGLGGPPHGKRASYLAAVSSTVTIIKATNEKTCKQLVVEKLAHRAVLAAAHKLTVEGRKMGLSAENDGLRTTLIVVIAHRGRVGYAYIGDGGGVLLRTSGVCEQFLVPQKAEGYAPNVLACSLGPVQHGAPVVGALLREPGDLLIIGSDGVFDRVGLETFSRDVLRYCIDRNGEMQSVAEVFLSELALFRDEQNHYVCDDNLTLAILGSGAAPKLASGFWQNHNNHTPVADAATETA